MITKAASPFRIAALICALIIQGPERAAAGAAAAPRRWALSSVTDILQQRSRVPSVAAEAIVGGLVGRLYPPPPPPIRTGFSNPVNNRAPLSPEAVAAGIALSTFVGVSICIYLAQFAMRHINWCFMDKWRDKWRNLVGSLLRAEQQQQAAAVEMAAGGAAQTHVTGHQGLAAATMATEADGAAPSGGAAGATPTEPDMPAAGHDAAMTSGARVSVVTPAAAPAVTPGPPAAGGARQLELEDRMLEGPCTPAQRHPAAPPEAMAAPPPPPISGHGESQSSPPAQAPWWDGPADPEWQQPMQPPTLQQQPWESCAQATSEAQVQGISSQLPGSGLNLHVRQLHLTPTPDAVSAASLHSGAHAPLAASSSRPGVVALAAGGRS